MEKYDANGGYLTQWGSDGSGIGQFHILYGIAADSGNNVYAVDGSRVQKFDANVPLPGAMGQHWQRKQRPVCAIPKAWRWDGGGNVYVCDSANNRVEKFDHQRQLPDAMGQFGNQQRPV